MKCPKCGYKIPSQQSATLKAKHGDDYFKQLALRSVAKRRFNKLLDKSA